MTIHKCEECGVEFDPAAAPESVATCPVCRNDFCPDCIEIHDGCEEPDDNLYECCVCGKICEDDDIAFCYNCGEPVCIEHRFDCETCNEVFCERCNDEHTHEQ